MFPSMRILKLHGIFMHFLGGCEFLEVPGFGSPQPPWKVPDHRRYSRGGSFWVFQWQKDLVPESQVPWARGTPKVIGRFVMFCIVLSCFLRVILEVTMTCYNACNICNLPGSVVPWNLANTGSPTAPCRGSDGLRSLASGPWCDAEWWPAAWPYATGHGSIWEQQVIFWRGEAMVGRDGFAE